MYFLLKSCSWQFQNLVKEGHKSGLKQKCQFKQKERERERQKEKRKRVKVKIVLSSELIKIGFILNLHDAKLKMAQLSLSPRISRILSILEILAHHLASFLLVFQLLYIGVPFFLYIVVWGLANLFLPQSRNMLQQVLFFQKLTFPDNFVGNFYSSLAMSCSPDTSGNNTPPIM